MSRQQKEERLHFRVTIDQKSIIARAAELQGITMTDFILKATCEAATQMILDQKHRKVPADKWAAIQAALAEPAQDIPELREMAKKYGHLIADRPVSVAAPEPVSVSYKQDLIAGLNSLLLAAEFTDMPVAAGAVQSKDADFSSASVSKTIKRDELAVA